MLSIKLAGKEELAWCQEQVTAHHYLHKPVDVRTSCVAYQVILQDEPVGCLIFGRPEAQRCNGWYGSVEDTQRRKDDPRYCPLTRWQILNLARVWLHPSIQHGGSRYIENAATWVIAQALRKIGSDYLVCKPPVWVEEPYEIREILSYCDTRIHQGTLYKAANFSLVRKNDYGIETYKRPIRRLTHAEHLAIHERSRHDKRAQKLRAARSITQLEWLELEA